MLQFVHTASIADVELHGTRSIDKVVLVMESFENYHGFIKNCAKICAFLSPQAKPGISHRSHTDVKFGAA